FDPPAAEILHRRSPEQQAEPQLRQAPERATAPPEPIAAAAHYSATASAASPGTKPVRAEASSAPQPRALKQLALYAPHRSQRWRAPAQRAALSRSPPHRESVRLVHALQPPPRAGPKQNPTAKPPSHSC